MPEAVIVSAARSPIGRARKGSLVSVRADDLAAVVVESAVAQVPGLAYDDIEDLMLGCALPGGEQGYNLARLVAVRLGHDFLPGTTVTRFCASSLQAARMAFHAIRAGEGDAYIVAGVETVSRLDRGHSDYIPGEDFSHPRYAEAARRTAARVEGQGRTWTDPRRDDELPDVYISMGQTAENVAEIEGVSRQQQDEYACLSQARAQLSIASGFWAENIVPIHLDDGTVVHVDDSPRAGVTIEALGELKPVFRRNGTVTAGNSCPLNDGAAALVVMSDTKARELGVEPLARIVSTGVSALSPEVMGLGPIAASRQAMARAGVTMADIDQVELNEAFAAQVIPSARRLGIDMDKLNVHGGAIAFGHPYGMTGARMLSTLVNSLRHSDGTLGLATLCVGAGQGMAMVLERLR